MTRVSTFFITMLSAFLLLSGTAFAQPGAVIYSGDKTADVWMFSLTNPNFTKIEFYRGAKLLGTVHQGANDGGILTDRGLTKGQPVQYMYRAYLSSGGFTDGDLLNGIFIGGDIWGQLVRLDTISMRADLVDTVKILPGGEMHFARGADVSWILGQAGVMPGIIVRASDDLTQFPHGRFSASGGILFDMNINCQGALGPLKNFKFFGTDATIQSDTECRMEKVELHRVKGEGRDDYAYIRSNANKLYAKDVLVTGESQLWGVQEADHCILDSNATIVGSNVINTEIRLGQVTLSPKDIPTSFRYNHVIDGGVSLSNKSVVEHNVFEPMSTLNISPAAGGFPPSDVKGVHVNYNHFNRVNGDVGNMSNFQADTIDGSLNFWGVCTGPTLSERATMGKVRLDPFLRVMYPQDSYWLDLTASKSSVIANDVDSIVYVGHFTNVLKGTDTAGVAVNYRVEIVGDTLMKGTAISDSKGKIRIVVRVPYKYHNAAGMSVYFSSDLQCIAKSYFVSVIAQTGPDLEVYDANIVQVFGGTDDMAPKKAFAVKATIVTTEPVAQRFKIHVDVNNHTYDEFYIIDKDNIGVTYMLENPMTDVALANGKSILIAFMVDELGITPGTVDVVVTVDPENVVDESNELNNSFITYGKAKSTFFGYPKDPKLNVFVQAIDEYPGTEMFRVQPWADSTRLFMEKVWPMNDSQTAFTTSDKVADFSYINPDTLQQDTFEHYLMKAYKQMRMEHPAYDKYVMAVQPNWFTFRLDRTNFNHRASQTLSWSGVWDLMVSSTGHYKHLVHSMGHAFGLRRMDIDPNDPAMREQYYDYFIGMDVNDGFDTEFHRIIESGANNKVSRRMNVKCVMGSSQLPNVSYDFYYWLNGEDYQHLFANVESFTSGKKSLKKDVVDKALFIEGSVDSTNRAFSFGPWARLASATPSGMVDDVHTTHVFKVLDNGGQELASYNYRPTFRALGLDEVDAATSPNPELAEEYFAFVVPCPDNAAKVVVEDKGNVVAERILSRNKPVVSIDYPGNGQDVKKEKFEARWSATDPDGDTDFWYNVYFSSDNGVSWHLMQYESKATADSIFGTANKSGYKLRVIANDGVNYSDTTEITFSIMTNTAVGDAPAVANFELKQNYPNPFNPATSLSFTLPEFQHVTLTVYDALGRSVRTLVNDTRSAGTYYVRFDGSALPSGTYVAVLRSGEKSSSIRMVLSK